ncbi:MAG: hypothetical protein ABIQ32_05455 [Sphingomicrobium sp.]
MDPGLRELRPDRPRKGLRPAGEELKGNRKKVLIAIAAVLSVVVLGRQMVGRDFDFDSDKRPVIASRPEARGAVTITAEQLYQAYRDDERAADRRFDDREMVVSGEFLRIVPDGYGSLDLRLKTSNPEIPVGIDVTQLAIEDAKKLVPGQQVTVSCKGMGGSGNELWVRDCAIQPGSDVTAPATQPSSNSSPPAAAEGNGA